MLGLDSSRVNHGRYAGMVNKTQKTANSHQEKSVLRPSMKLINNPEKRS